MSYQHPTLPDFIVAIDVADDKAWESFLRCPRAQALVATYNPKGGRPNVAKMSSAELAVHLAAVNTRAKAKFPTCLVLSATRYKCTACSATFSCTYFKFTNYGQHQRTCSFLVRQATDPRSTQRSIGLNTTDAQWRLTSAFGEDTVTPVRRRQPDESDDDVGLVAGGDGAAAAAPARGGGDGDGDGDDDDDHDGDGGDDDNQGEEAPAVALAATSAMSTAKRLSIALAPPAKRIRLEQDEPDIVPAPRAAAPVPKRAGDATTSTPLPKRARMHESGHNDTPSTHAAARSSNAATPSAASGAQASARRDASA